MFLLAIHAKFVFFFLPNSQFLCSLFFQKYIFFLFICFDVLVVFLRQKRNLGEELAPPPNSPLTHHQKALSILHFYSTKIDTDNNNTYNFCLKFSTLTDALSQSLVPLIHPPVFLPSYFSSAFVFVPLIKVSIYISKI